MAKERSERGERKDKGEERDSEFIDKLVHTSTALQKLLRAVSASVLQHS
jgi:hypothetical protein